MSTPSRVLVVDDDKYDNDRYCQLLSSVGYDVQGVMDAELALQTIFVRGFDVVLLDMLLPMRVQGRLDFGGIELLRRIKERDETTQVIAVTGYGSRELATEAMAAGAMDYITKDLDTDERLPGSVHIAVRRAQQLRIAKLIGSGPVSELSLAMPDHLIANSDAMRQVLRRAQRLASIDGSLLVVGEPGVGKELIASLLHLNSRYASGPFMVVSCRMLSANLIELWGEQAHPGSGFCAQTESGTLVLKQIENLSFNQQKQLVNLVDRKVYLPIGAIQPISCDLRIIATTLADLERLVRQGRFWRPLYEALNLAIIHVPPLRERRDDDIMAIAGYLLRRYGLASEISSAAADMLVTYDYTTGNIRELEEILRRAATEASGGLIQPHHLPETLHALKPNAPQVDLLSTNTDSVELCVRFLPGDAPIAIWESDIGGSSRSRIKLPFAEVDIPLLLRALDAVQWPEYPTIGPQFTNDETLQLTQLGLWNAGRVIFDVERSIGQLLYRTIMADAAGRSALDAARNSAIEKQQSLSLLLRFPPDAILLATLPWELLWDEHQPLLLSSAKLASCVRYIDLPKALPPAPPIGKKLRLLAVCPQQGIPEQLHVEEFINLTNALQPLVDAGLLFIEELRPVFKHNLTDRLQDGESIDILHFYGHGSWRNNAAHLLLDDGLLSANQIASLAGDIPLIVLHACRSGAIGADGLFTGIAPMLSAEGVAAVVAMQFTVSVEAANRFAVVLYRNLARGESLQTAVAKGRQALYAEHKQSWYVPVVYIRSRDIKPVVLVRK